ncbi:hypothetical protein OF83DRAFT_1132816 [Amylostereum chailletii]|nr:hypothetical protein OF83DRAFT_1132816 [Amylostereum chailletii]
MSRPHAGSSDVVEPRLSTLSLSPTAGVTSFDSQRPNRRPKEDQFIEKYGRRHHSYGSTKAPYTLSYDKDILDRDAIHQTFRTSLVSSPTIMSTEGRAPERVLDLGCGVGAWTVNSARLWTKSEFVGFDFVNIQVPLSYLEPSVARRITWQHGNFLSQRLPFDDNSFDHVHIVNIGRGVPENKWIALFEEINRVLEPDGFVEHSEEDIIFPIIPRWFTDSLRKPQAKANGQPPDGPHVIGAEDSDNSSHNSEHDHVILEMLFESVHSSRFINMKPTAVLPVYYAIFSRYYHGPPILCGMPYLAPLPPLPEGPHTSGTLGSSSGSSLQREPSLSTRPSTRSSSRRSSTATTSDISRSLSFTSDNDPNDTYSLATDSTHESATVADALPRPVGTVQPLSSSELWMTVGRLVPGNESTQPPGPFPKKTIPLNDRTRALILYHSYLGVLGCREAMWEELLTLQTTPGQKERLLKLGWAPKRSQDSSDLEDLPLEERRALEARWEMDDRLRFEELFDRFESDIRARVAFWYSLTELGFEYPKREPLLKSELLEEERIRRAIIDARASNREYDYDVPSRILRVFVGFKEADGDVFADDEQDTMDT